jgi:hypothetical protein
VPVHEPRPRCPDFGGCTRTTIATEAVGSTGDLIQLTDGTIINLVGMNHTVLHDHPLCALTPRNYIESAGLVLAKSRMGVDADHKVQR